jgi:hypothetical protein
VSRRHVNDRPPATLVAALGVALLAIVLAAPVTAAATPGARATRAPAKASVDAAHLTWTRSPGGAPGAGNLNSSLVGFVPIWTSTDGLRWKRAQGPRSAFPANISVADVVHTGSRFLAFGYPRSSTDAVLAWTSKDGTKWTRYRAKGFPPTSKPGAPASGATVTKTGVLLKVLDVNNTAHLWSMSNGRWRVLGDLPDVGQTVVDRVLPTRNGRSFIAVGHSNNAAAAWTSKTGKTWSTKPILGMAPGDGSTMEDAVASGHGFVAVGSGSGLDHEVANAWTSSNGNRWQPVSGSTARFTGHSGRQTAMTVATTYGTALIAAGYDGGNVGIWTSRDGRTWKDVPETIQFLVKTGTVGYSSGVAAGNGHVVVIFREEQYNSTSNDYDITGLGILSGSAKR